MENEEMQCYNRGCGKKFSPSSNTDESCRHHPGMPVFHDAYKGWSCCSKKCTDFTEFLNIKGCTLSKHSNVKPVEPETPKNTVPDIEVVEVKPIVRSVLKRPPFDSPLTKLVPEVASSLLQELQTIKVTKENDSDEIKIGTSCKNNGCSTTYTGLDSNNSTCIYHPGSPIFHEGLKFWSCCQKRTTDFNAFLAQVGCEQGKHLWKSKENDKKTVRCRWDHHQTGSHVIISIYAKKYCPKLSTVKINPIRLFVSLVFPENSNATFDLDIELNGIVNVGASQLSMYGMKAEIKLKKAEPGHWPRLEIKNAAQTKDVLLTAEEKKNQVCDITSQVEDVDLSDL